MGCLNLKEVLVFLEDLIVFSSTLEEHEEHPMLGFTGYYRRFIHDYFELADGTPSSSPHPGCDAGESSSSPPVHNPPNQ